MNFGKLAMLHRMAGAGPILIYASNQEDDVKNFTTIYKACVTVPAKLNYEKIQYFAGILFWHIISRK